MIRKALGISFDFGLICLSVILVIILTFTDLEVIKNLTADDNTKVSRLLSQIENPETTIYVEESNQTPKNLDTDARKCTHFDCFDIYRCGVHHQKLLVHVPKPIQFLDHKGNPVAPMTQDYVTILEAIAASEYYTEDYNEACVFVPALDLLNQRSLKVRY